MTSRSWSDRAFHTVSVRILVDGPDTESPRAARAAAGSRRRRWSKLRRPCVGITTPLATGHVYSGGRRGRQGPDRVLKQQNRRRSDVRPTG